MSRDARVQAKDYKPFRTVDVLWGNTTKLAIRAPLERIPRATAPSTHRDLPLPPGGGPRPPRVCFRCLSTTTSPLGPGLGLALPVRRRTPPPLANGHCLVVKKKEEDGSI